MADSQTRASAGSLVVCVLLVLAGCGGLGGTATPERTPFAVPSETDRVTTDDDGVTGGYPPGVNESGVVDAVALLSTHSRELRDRSVTVQSNFVRRYAANGTLRYWARDVGRYDGSEAHVVRQVTGPGASSVPGREGRLEWWSNGTAALRTTVAGGETTYRAVPRPGPEVLDRDRRDRLFALFSSLDPVLAERQTEDGVERVVLRAERSNASGVPGDALALGPAEDPRNVTFVAVVTAAGRVLGYDLSYEATVGNATVRVTWGVRFEELDSTTVSRPAWVESAVAEVCAGADRPEWCGR